MANTPLAKATLEPTEKLSVLATLVVSDWRVTSDSGFAGATGQLWHVYAQGLGLDMDNFCSKYALFKG